MAGETFLLAVPDPRNHTATERYRSPRGQAPWLAPTPTPTFTGGVIRDTATTGYAVGVVRDNDPMMWMLVSNPYGNGWSLYGQDAIKSVTGGVVDAMGKGGWWFFSGTDRARSTFTSRQGAGRPGALCRRSG